MKDFKIKIPISWITFPFRLRLGLLYTLIGGSDHNRREIVELKQQVKELNNHLYHVRRSLAFDSSSYHYHRYVQNYQSDVSSLADRKGREAEIFLMLARNPNLPLDQITALANSPDKKVREAVARNPELPFRLSRKLATDEASFVRWAIAQNPKTAPPVLSLLAESELNSGWMDIYYSVVKHRACPPCVRRNLIREWDMYLTKKERERFQIHSDIGRGLGNPS